MSSDSKEAATSTTTTTSPDAPPAKTSAGQATIPAGGDLATLLDTALSSRLGEDPDPRAAGLLRNLAEEWAGIVEEDVSVADLKMIAATFSEIRKALTAFRPYAPVRKITAFGSARTQPGMPVYEMAREFGRLAAEAEYMVITGAGPGIMQAVPEGAGRENTFGVNISLPFEQSANPVIHGDPKCIDFKYFFTRKLFFLKEASAVVLFPGGFGSHDEAFECLTLLQTGKGHMVPLLCLDVPGSSYWTAWREFLAEELLERGLIAEDDLNLFELFEDPAAAMRRIQSFYRVYHSSRYLRGQLLIRTKRKLSKEFLTELTGEFEDVLGGKAIVHTEPLREERDEPYTLELDRIIVPFDRVGHGRLRRLIDRINGFE